MSDHPEGVLAVVPVTGGGLGGGLIVIILIELLRGEMSVCLSVCLCVVARSTGLGRALKVK